MFFKTYLNFSSALVLLLVTTHCDSSKVLDDTLGVHRLSSTGFSTGYEKNVFNNFRFFVRYLGNSIFTSEVK